MKNYNVGKEHPKFIDLTGKRVGDLTIEEYVYRKGRGKEGRWVWRCSCSCGEECYVRTVRLTREEPQQCCKKCADLNSSKYRLLPDNMSLKNRIIRVYKRNASLRGYSFDLTPDEVIKLIQEKCHYCNSAPKVNKGDIPYFTKGLEFPRNGIDRKDNTLGYTLKNAVPCCDNCNRGKLELSEADFLAWVETIYNHKIKQNGH